MNRPSDADIREAVKRLRRDTRLMGFATRGTVDSVLELIDPKRYSHHPAHRGWILDNQSRYFHIDESGDPGVDVIGHVLDALNALDAKPSDV